MKVWRMYIEVFIIGVDVFVVWLLLLVEFVMSGGI